MEENKKYWKSIDSFKDPKTFNEAARNEFPDDIMEAPDKMTRKKFLSIMGASIALASLSGCRKPVQKVVPYVKAPQTVIPGISNYYATTMPFGMNSYGVIVKSNEGRPTFIEGNPHHNSSLGATNGFVQASILDLYDPDRSTYIRNNGKKGSLNKFKQKVAQLCKDGKKIRIVSPSFSSPSIRKIKDLMEKNSNIEWVCYDRMNNENEYNGIELATGKKCKAIYHFDRVNRVVSIDSDFLNLDENSIYNTKKFSSRRKVRGVDHSEAKMNRLYVIESNMSQTGAMADNRLRLKQSQIDHFVYELRKRFDNVESGQEWIDKLYDDIKVGSKCKITGDPNNAIIKGGPRLSKESHAYIAEMNKMLEAFDSDKPAVQYVPLNLRKVNSCPSNSSDYAKLLNEIKNNEIECVIFLDVNPAYTSSMNDFKNVPVKVHFGMHYDETAKLCDWHIPKAHYLESWGDCESIDGTISIIQPLIAPLYPDSFSELDFVMETLKSLPNLLTDDKECKDRWDLKDDKFKEDTPFLKFLWNERMPIFNSSNSKISKSDKDFLSDLMSDPKYFSYEFMKSKYSSKWNKYLYDGKVRKGYPKDVYLSTKDWNPLDIQYKNRSNANLELVFYTSGNVYDGRFANNGWLQENPDTISKITWDNAAIMSVTTAKKLGYKNKELISIEANGAKVDLPVWILPGHADNQISVQVGYGRNFESRIANGVGGNVYPLMNGSYATSCKHSSKGVDYTVACTQDHHGMNSENPSQDAADREVQSRLPDLFRELTLEEYRDKGPYKKVEKRDKDKHLNTYKKDEYGNLLRDEKGNKIKGPRKTLFEHPYQEIYDRPYSPDNPPQWAMSIDLNSCTGCNSCAIACQSENNIPIVGKDQVEKGREMNWVRLDRYYKGTDIDNPEVAFQPVSCMHCESAPCEQVCPVAATVHDDEGLNVMVYNRCIGTRYCSNNCPYKVRRFNFHNYTYDTPEIVQMANNPDVTVRFRGVMEKCTYCIQRIKEVSHKSKVEKKPVADYNLEAACQRACPADCVDFGNKNNPNEEIYNSRKDDRSYGLLEELNTVPRTTYMAKLRNPNTKIKKPYKVQA